MDIIKEYRINTDIIRENNRQLPQLSWSFHYFYECLAEDFALWIRERELPFFWKGKSYAFRESKQAMKHDIF